MVHQTCLKSSMCCIVLLLHSTTALLALLCRSCRSRYSYAAMFTARQLPGALDLLQLVTSHRAQCSVPAYELDHTVPVLQIGRAGRDGLPSKCKLMWSAQDWVKNNMIQVNPFHENATSQSPDAKHCCRELPTLRVLDLKLHCSKGLHQ